MGSAPYFRTIRGATIRECIWHSQNLQDEATYSMALWHAQAHLLDFQQVVTAVQIIQMSSEQVCPASSDLLHVHLALAGTCFSCCYCLSKGAC